MNFPHPANCRYERKFFITKMPRERVEVVVKNHSSLLQEVYPPRFVNNIYLDSTDYRCYFDNVDGISDRTKFRIRWYGELFGHIQKPVLEIKTKTGLLGGKLSYPLSSFSLRPDFSPESVLQTLLCSQIPESLKSLLPSLRPTLVNRYRRQYFRSSSRSFRTTLDYHQEFHKPSTPLHSSLASHRDHHSCILEIKYAPEFQEDANSITQFFPFRMTKSSKYVRGLRIIKGLQD